MDRGREGLAERVTAWSGADEGWEREPADADRTRRRDVLLAVGALAAGSLGIELLRSIDALGPSQDSWVWPHVAVALGTLPLALRHRFPLLVAAALSLHLFVVGVLLPAVAVSTPMQVVYFVAIFTGVAWARDRRLMLLVVLGILLLMFGWLTWQLAVGSGVEQALSRDGRPLERQGLFSPSAAYVTYTLVINVVYFGGAVMGGQAAWRAALQRQRLADQARTIDAQATGLRRQAVVEERLRIARELHDVVAHHISVIGIQAAAARRVLRVDPDAAAGALRSVETSSRDAVTQMRGLLGTLRAGDDTDRSATGDHSGTVAGRHTAHGTSRAPEPGLADVAALTAAAEAGGLEVVCHVVEDRPGAVAAVPAPLGLSLYR
ncbi:MAG: Histidine kinase, partial [Humibacillus sp.]|nr:Histidine kinase [Humibacillus sp.]